MGGPPSHHPWSAAHLLLISSLAISLHNTLFPSTRSANTNANTKGARYFLLCVVVASVVLDEEVIEWSEASALIWHVQPRLWFTLR
jgi:hypothetical protein